MATTKDSTGGKVKKKERLQSEGGAFRWKPRHYVLAYKMAKDGSGNGEIATAIGVSRVAFFKRLKKDEEMAAAVADGREAKESFVDYVHGQLPKKLKRYWDMVLEAEKGKYRKSVVGDQDHGRMAWKVRSQLRQLGRRMRQRLFLHALVHCNFNTSEACRMVYLSTVTYFKWCNESMFKGLLDAIHQAKKDLFESALIDLVKKGDTAAILFANRTMNRDRGYNDKVVVDVSGTIEHKVTIDQLDLPLDVRLKLLQAIRQTEEKKNLPMIELDQPQEDE